MTATSSSSGPPLDEPIKAAELVDRLLFPAPQSTYHPGCWPGEMIWLNPRGESSSEGSGYDDGVDVDRIPALLLLAPVSSYFVLCFHSNGDDLGRFYSFCHRLRVCCSVHVLAIEYPGYGICPGTQATEQTVNRHAHVAFRFLTETLKWPVEDILVFGRSVGCGPALQIASRHNVRGVALVSPFLSLRDLAKGFVGAMADYVPQRYDNLELVRKVTSPLLVVHGKQDTLVPVEHGLTLFEACSARKSLVSPENMGHNTNLNRDTSYFAVPFLSFFGLLPPVQREVHIPLSVFQRPPVPEVACMSFLGPHCCMPRNGPGAIPKQPAYRTMPALDPIRSSSSDTNASYCHQHQQGGTFHSYSGYNSDCNNSSLNCSKPPATNSNSNRGSHYEGIARMRSSGSTASVQRGRPKLSKVAPSRSCLAEPGHDDLRQRSFSGRGEDYFSSFGNDYEERTSGDEVDTEGIVLVEDEAQASGVVFEGLSFATPPKAREDESAEEVVGMSISASIPDLPMPWRPPSELEVPCSKSPKSRSGGERIKSLGFKTARGKLGPSSSQGTTDSSGSGEETREPSDAEEVREAPSTTEDHDVCIDENFIRSV
mmetsp:Transcript_4645/g.10014  ORF Transcript_4645/g.10014 Transcript_4645/m.10014 type:complete len:597 (+) Transcript_4645:244-2034(+)